MGTGSLSWKQSSWGVALTTYPYQVPRLQKQYSDTCIPPLGLHGLFYGECYLYFSYQPAKWHRNYKMPIIGSVHIL